MKLIITTKKFLAPAIAALALMFFSQMTCLAQFITVSGDWITVLPVGSVTEAGSNFFSTYNSAANQTQISIDGSGKFSFRVDVSKIDTDWSPSLKLYIRRSGDGNNGHPNSIITGGTTFFQLTAINQTFFSGERQWHNIPVQFQLTGVSVLVPAKTHTSTILYTITSI